MNENVFNVKIVILNFTT